jgi:hypothetical protein
LKVPEIRRNCMGIRVKPLTIPNAGIDTIDVTIEETYDVQGLGKDTVTLTGTLVADRGVPLLRLGEKKVGWNSAMVVANFTSLKLSGESNVFGTVKVSLDKSMPAVAVANACHCSAAIGVVVSMPRLGVTLRTAEPMQLQSEVTTIPPIGDEKTESVLPVDLIDTKSNRKRGSLTKARVIWRELLEQKRHPVK